MGDGTGLALVAVGPEGNRQTSVRPARPSRCCLPGASHICPSTVMDAELGSL